jgi:hypothetical protein
VSADYHNEAAYRRPDQTRRRDRQTARRLSEPVRDLAANSGNNAMSRDAGFTTDFLKRHQDTLFFGSDCSCTDGHGGGVSQNNNPAAARLAGKCVARDVELVEAHNLGGRLPEDRVGQHPQAAADSCVTKPQPRVVLPTAHSLSCACTLDLGVGGRGSHLPVI